MPVTVTTRYGFYNAANSEITVELPGGDLSVCVKENGDVILTGDAHLIYTGNIIR